MAVSEPNYFSLNDQPAKSLSDSKSKLCEVFVRNVEAGLNQDVHGEVGGGEIFCFGQSERSQDELGEFTVAKDPWTFLGMNCFDLIRANVWVVLTDGSINRGKIGNHS